MSGEAFAFAEFANSSRGLMARVILPNNVMAVLADIASITYAVYDKTAGTGPVTGTLTVSEVMYATAQAWGRDLLGYCFLWPAPGTLWPSPRRRYKVVLTFTMVNPYPASPSLAGKSFILVYQPETKDPSG